MKPLSAKSFLISFSIISIPMLFVIKNANAEPPPCIHLGNPSIGATCYTEVSYNARVENRKNPDTFKITQGALPGFVIIDTRNFIEGRNGNTQGPSINIIRANTKMQVNNSYTSALNELYDFFNKIESQIKFKSLDIGGFLSIKTRAETQLNNNRNIVSNINSNVEAVEIEGSAQAIWVDTPIATIYRSGGTLRGVIRVYQRYIGTPQDANRIVEQAKNELMYQYMK